MERPLGCLHIDIVFLSSPGMFAQENYETENISYGVRSEAISRLALDRPEVLLNVVELSPHMKGECGHWVVYAMCMRVIMSLPKR
jgi:hypothetical protein